MLYAGRQSKQPERLTVPKRQSLHSRRSGTELDMEESQAVLLRRHSHQCSSTDRNSFFTSRATLGSGLCSLDRCSTDLLTTNAKIRVGFRRSSGDKGGATESLAVVSSSRTCGHPCHAVLLTSKRRGHSSNVLASSAEHMETFCTVVIGTTYGSALSSQYFCSFRP